MNMSIIATYECRWRRVVDDVCVPRSGATQIRLSLFQYNG